MKTRNKMKNIFGILELAHLSQKDIAWNLHPIYFDHNYDARFGPVM
jgi:hypothetical protein